MAEIITSGKNVKYVDSNFKSHTFSSNIYGMEIQFSVLQLEQSVFIWIGVVQQKCLTDLNLGLQSKFGKTPLSTHLLGNSSDISIALTSKLSKKLNKPVYLSFNISDTKMITEVTRTLMQEIERSPHCF